MKGSPLTHWTVLKSSTIVTKPACLFMGKLLALPVQAVLNMLKREVHYMGKRDVGGCMPQVCKGSQ